MSETTKKPRNFGDASLYIDGYFSKRIRSGEDPDYGYPQNGLPEVGAASMQVKTGFIAALQAGKK